VPKHGAHLLNRYACFEAERCEGVPKVMEPDARQLRVRKQRVERAAHEVLTLDRPAYLVGEDEILIGPFLAHCEPLGFLIRPVARAHVPLCAGASAEWS